MLAVCGVSSTEAAGFLGQSELRVGAQGGGAVILAAEDGYRIGAGDLLEISVFKVPELSKTVQVSGTGTVNIPLLGEISVAGKTTAELERELTAELAKDYLQNPQVSVLVKEYNSQSVTINGAVQKPGVYPIKTSTSLLQLVALAGGFQEMSNSTVLILRKKGCKKSAARFDIDAIQSGRAC